MRNLIISVVALSAAACAGGAANSDTAALRDSAIVAGPPAISPAPAADSQSGGATRQPPTSSGRSAPAAPAERRDTSPKSAGSAAQADSVRGVVSVVGTSFDKRVMLAVPGTRRRVEVTGALSTLIGHVAGAEVVAVGTVSGDRIDATRFTVRSVDGQPAIDGTLRTENGSLFIVTEAGTRTRIVSPPPPLVGKEGSRVWITGDPAKSVSSFGFIDPPR